MAEIKEVPKGKIFRNGEFRPDVSVAGDTENTRDANLTFFMLAGGFEKGNFIESRNSDSEKIYEEFSTELTEGSRIKAIKAKDVKSITKSLKSDDDTKKAEDVEVGG